MQGPKAVLGPGTGLGEAQLFWDEIQGGYKVWPSEGSHSGFAPRGWKQRALQARPLLLAYPFLSSSPFPSTRAGLAAVVLCCNDRQGCPLAAARSACSLANLFVDGCAHAGIRGEGTGQL